jgi:hypothetical protein
MVHTIEVTAVRSVHCLTRLQNLGKLSVNCLITSPVECHHCHWFGEWWLARRNNLTKWTLRAPAHYGRAQDPGLKLERERPPNLRGFNAGGLRQPHRSLSPR